MEDCKGCKREFEEKSLIAGYCNPCLLDLQEKYKEKEISSKKEPSTEPMKAAKDKDTMVKFLSSIALIGFMIYFFDWKDDPSQQRVSAPYVSNPTKIKIRSVGCKKSDEVSAATRDLINGGLSAFMTHRDCIIVMKGQPIKVLDRGMFHTKVLYTLEGQSSRVLWIGSDVME